MPFVCQTSTQQEHWASYPERRRGAVLEIQESTGQAGVGRVMAVKGRKHLGGHSISLTALIVEQWDPPSAIDADAPRLNPGKFQTLGY